MSFCCFTQGMLCVHPIEKGMPGFVITQKSLAVSGVDACSERLALLKSDDIQGLPAARSCRRGLLE
jgi:uncharacterized small protein (DUF1192 family)